jgi:hypothetical protein
LDLTGRDSTDCGSVIISVRGNEPAEQSRHTAELPLTKIASKGT